MKKVFLLTTYYLLLTTFLSGCATVPVAGSGYIPAAAFARTCDADYHWEALTKKIILKKDDQEVRMMVDSRSALVNDAVQIMDQEARFYQGQALIPQSFVYKTLTPLFKKAPVKRAPVPAALLSIKTVIIDPGHGGKDPGAIGRSGLKEKDIVLDIAQRLKQKLNAAGINVILTRGRDEFVSLDQRSRIANAHAEEADFFISIHANASRSRWIGGVEVFYLSESIDDNQRSLKAAKNYDLNLEEGYSGKDTAAILWDLLHSDDRKSSIELAEFVCRSLSKTLAQQNRGKKPGRLYVLNTNISAILIEVGFISNPQEEKRLTTGAYRDKIAGGIARGISQYNRHFAQSRKR